MRKPFYFAKLSLVLVISGAFGARAADSIPTRQGELTIVPIQHATLALRWNERLILVDPVGPASPFQALGTADLILLTDIHGDHFSKDTLKTVSGEKARLVAPPAVTEQLPPELKRQTDTLENGARKEINNMLVEAIAAYNLSPERQKFHAKGRGNGYVLNLGGKRIYISGDTEGVPEMLALKDIDVAFVCMNLPYTMTVEQAAEAVKAFKPKIVYPYHSRGSDTGKFKQLVEAAGLNIEVRLRDWYKQ